MPASKDKETLLLEASRWFARMRGPDAETSRFAFEAWRRADPEHDRAYRGLEQSWRNASLIAQTSVGRNRSLARARRPWHGLSPYRIALAAGAVVLLAVGLSTLLYREWAATTSTARAQIATSVGNLRTVRLADGSAITLDTNSAITVDFGSSRRVVHLLHGRARFDVAHDARRPFAVDAGAGEVVARGTLFDVDVTRPDLRVILYRGAVDVKLSPPGRAPTLVQRLGPGQRFIQADGGSDAVVDPAPKGEDHWVGGMLSFDAVPLADVAAQANRYTADHVRVNPDVADLKVTGAFRSGRSEDLARSLAATFNLTVRHLPDGDWELGRS
jgi:transmembrane sensor